MYCVSSSSPLASECSYSYSFADLIYIGIGEFVSTYVYMATWICESLTASPGTSPL